MSEFSAAAREAVTRPYDIIASVFAQNPRGNTVADVVAEFSRRLNLAAGDQNPLLAHIPLLNVTPAEQIAPNSLVRLRCMVQDMFDPECHLGAYEQINSTTGAKTVCTGLFSDSLQFQPGCVLNEDRSTQVFAECQSMYCVSLPGETDWVKQLDDVAPSSTSSSTQSNLKRKGGDSEIAEDCVMNEATNAVTTSSGTSDATVVQALGSGDTPAQAAAGSGTSAVPPTPLAVLQRFGAVAPGAINAIVRFYDAAESESLRLGGQPLEIVGILSKDAVDEDDGMNDVNDAEIGSDTKKVRMELSGDGAVMIDDTVAFDAWERAAHHPPVSLVHRVHCISMRKLSPHFPFQRDADLGTSAAVMSIPTNQSARDRLLQARESLVNFLANVFAGDRISAEFFMLHLISRVHTRSDVLALGRFSLNVFGIPAATVQQPCLAHFLQAVCERLLPAVVTLPLSIDELDASLYAPRKDYEANRMERGLLHCAPGTQVLVDETLLTPGQLLQPATVNLKILATLMQQQKLVVDLGQYAEPLELDVDMPVCVLSTSKSIVPPDCRVQWLPSQTILNQDSMSTLIRSISESQWLEWRRYLSACKHLNFSIDETVAAVVQSDFIALRQQSPEVREDILHYFLTLSRLMGLSYMETALTTERWSQMRALDSQRSRQATQQRTNSTG